MLVVRRNFSLVPHAQIETVLPGEGGGASASYHVYRVFSTPIAAGTVTLGSNLPGSLPYFVLLYGGNHFQRHTSRNRRRPSVQRPLRAVTDSGQRQRRRQFGSVFRKPAKAPALGSGGSAVGGSGGGSSINSLSSKSRESSGGVVVSSAVQRGVSGESIELIPTAQAQAAAPPSRRASTASAADSVGAVAATVNANPSWQLTPRYSLGGATRGVTSIATRADKHAKKAAGTAMKIAAISSAGTAAASAASGGAGGGVEVAKQPRVRLKVTLLCEHGIFVQMDDLHRLENTPTDDEVSPTFELALKVPSQGGGCGGGGDDGVHDAEPRSPGSLPPPMEEALTATLDFEHVASAEILGIQDSMSMKAAFGVEGRYFNPRVQQSEHFIEPWR